MSHHSSFFETNLKKTFNFDLRYYQTYPAYYLKHLAPNQKGLLVNHLMGTGKTFTGINFMTDYPDKKPFVVCPNHLISNWINELAKLGINNIDVTFMNFDEFVKHILEQTDNASAFANHIVIFDEGHNLIYKIRNEMNEDDIPPLYEIMAHFHKILFLTGTPFYTDEYDIIYIINLVAGETILPFNKSLFQDTYFKTSRTKSALFGWLTPVLNSKIVLFSIIAGFFMTYIFGMLRAVEANTNRSKITGEYIDMFLGLFSAHPIDNVYHHYDNIQQLKHEIEEKKNDPAYKIVYKYLDLFGWGDSLNNADSKSMQRIAAGVMIFLVGCVVFATTFAVMSLFDLQNIKTLDSKRLGKKIKQYISYYEIKERQSMIRTLQVKKCHSDVENDGYFMRLFCRSYLEKLRHSAFPSKEFHVKKTQYNALQMELFIKMCYNRLTAEDVMLLGIKNTQRSAELYTQLTKEDFLRYGRAIGNLILGSHIPEKFTEIIRLSHKKQTVIYSNFYENGILLFAKLLTLNGFSYEIISPTITSAELSQIVRRFKNREIQYILLHPFFTEGISIMGADQLHILEPLESFAKFDQLTYRVVRYNSHVHLPLRERKVKIYQWISTTVSFAKLILEKFKGWKRFSPQVIYWRRLAEFDDEMSADSILYDKNIKTSKLFNEFNESIKDYSIESCYHSNTNFECDTPYAFREFLKRSYSNTS